MSSKRTLSWRTQNGDLERVCDMPDERLLEVHARLRLAIIKHKLTTGHTSLSQLTLDYLEEEIAERGIVHE